MRKWPVLAIAGLLAFGCGPSDKEAAPEKVASPGETIAPLAEIIAEKFDGAMTSFAEGDIGRATGMLLDITLLVGPETDLPEGFKKEIEQSRGAYAANDLAAARGHIGTALKIWNPEKGGGEVAPGPDSGTPGPLAQLLRDKLVAARDLMARGDAKSAVTTILEALLLLSPARAN